MTKTEIWKPISKKLYYYESWINQDYEVSNYGRIRNKKTGKIINPFLTSRKNNLKWTMHYGTITLQFYVDHTVYTTFVGDCYGRHIKHRDGNMFNNTLDNLYL